ncbi:Serine/threonine-protein kinase GRIK2 [Acorus calamus]|uniref:Serine/threonine-protein kinase GRIK2 n=1 Tax=Acorus calamus TaxID=4465 RepID=A0AAV9FPT8_ACOCL|nr:Serine/threonine-protein kinase GRIK2 [Acorus calamus]
MPYGLRMNPCECLHRPPLRPIFSDLEASIMKMLDHPNIVNLIEVIDDPNTDSFYMVLEYVEGKWVFEGSGFSMLMIWPRILACDFGGGKAEKLALAKSDKELLLTNVASRNQSEGSPQYEEGGDLVFRLVVGMTVLPRVQ